MVAPTVNYNIYPVGTDLPDGPFYVIVRRANHRPFFAIVSRTVEDACPYR
jgi:hypothetical protein